MHIPSIKVTKIKDFDITPPKKKAFAIETPPDVPKQHSLSVFSARRGGGKSVACTAYVKKLMDHNCMQRVMIITPTWNSNKEIFAPLNIDPEDVLEPSKTALATVIERVVKQRRRSMSNTCLRNVDITTLRRPCDRLLVWKLCQQ